MTTILISPSHLVISETFIANHAEIIQKCGMLVAHIILANADDLFWQSIPVISLGKRQLRPIYDRVFRAILRRLGIPLSPWYSYDLAMRKLLKDHPIEFQSILIEYANTAYYNYNIVHEWLAQDKKVLVHLHGYDTIVEWFPSDYTQKLKQLTESGAIILANSEFTASRIASWGILPERLFVKYLGVQIPEEARQHHLRNEVTILHLGRLIDVKAPDLTIKAFEIACERGLKGQLLVAGDGVLRAECQHLREQSAWKDRISLLGAVDWNTASQLLLSADIFTLHSIVSQETGRMEAFGLAPVEAMASGLPVITCALGGIKETVVDGETGIFFPTTDVEAQANAFLMLARNPELRQKLGAQGRARVIEYFSIEREKRELLRLLGYADE